MFISYHFGLFKSLTEFYRQVEAEIHDTRGHVCLFAFTKKNKYQKKETQGSGEEAISL